MQSSEYTYKEKIKKSSKGSKQEHNQEPYGKSYKDKKDFSKERKHKREAYNA